MIRFTNLTRKSVSTPVFKRLYKRVFPKGDMELSLVFAPPAHMKKLNTAYRGARKTANVLSFLVDKNTGEIFLNRNEADLPHLFVHGCFHLKGLRHYTDRQWRAMERREREVLNSR